MSKPFSQSIIISKVKDCAPRLKFVARYSTGEDCITACMHGYEKRSFVYLLTVYFEGRDYCIYVGKTRSQYSRFLSHIKRFEFDKVYLFECDPKYLAESEALVIGSVYNMAHKLKETYRNTSFLQYENEKKYSQLLRCVKQEFIAFADSYDGFIESLQNAISDSGHTRRDIKELKNTKALIEKMAASLDDYDIGGCEFEEGIALPSFKELLCENLGRVNIED